MSSISNRERVIVGGMHAILHDAVGTAILVVISASFRVAGQVTTPDNESGIQRLCTLDIPEFSERKKNKPKPWR